MSFRIGGHFREDPWLSFFYPSMDKGSLLVHNGGKEWHMNNNDYFRSLRYALDLSDAEILRLYGLLSHPMDIGTIIAHLTPEEVPGYKAMSDLDMCAFLDGLILDRRGPRPDGTRVVPAAHLSNNEILKKIRIALNMDEEAMLNALKRGGFTMTAAELGALFRKEGHRNFKPCGDQVMRYFLRGLAKNQD